MGNYLIVTAMYLLQDYSKYRIIWLLSCSSIRQYIQYGYPGQQLDLMYVLFYPDAFPIAKLISNPAWVNVEPGKTTVYDIHLMDSTFHVGFDEKTFHSRKDHSST
jgi:hypothetical protein